MRRALSELEDVGGSGRECPAAGVWPGEAGRTALFHRGKYIAMIHIVSREKMLGIWVPFVQQQTGSRGVGGRVSLLLLLILTLILILLRIVILLLIVILCWSQSQSCS